MTTPRKKTSGRRKGGGLSRLKLAAMAMAVAYQNHPEDVPPRVVWSDWCSESYREWLLREARKFIRGVNVRKP